MGNELRSLREMRHVDKTFYLFSDAEFYEPVHKIYRPDGELSRVVETILTDSSNDSRIWRDGIWTHVIPTKPTGSLPRQGWKIHISATNENCPEILKVVAQTLAPMNVQFKFANDRQTLCLLTSKRWARGGSGKFITIYPDSVPTFRSLIALLYDQLRDYSGSYILSDKRYLDSRCVYYRYGSIQSQVMIDEFGRKIEYLTGPNGERCPDDRSPYYNKPDWIDEVFPEAEDDADTGDITLGEGRYSIESALSFTNTGGVYLANEVQSGRRVIIKEARPGVELGSHGQDATTRLANEAEILQAMTGSGVTPELVEIFSDWENLYLVEEYIDAQNMRRAMLENTPLLKVNPDPGSSLEFFIQYQQMFLNIFKSVAAFHERGLVIGDLSPMNILINNQTLKVTVIDLEGAFHASSPTPQDIHTPGFRSKAKGRTSASKIDDDLYALGVMMMYSIFPIAAMAFLRNDIFENVLPILIEDVGWSKTAVLHIARQLVNSEISCSEAIQKLEASPRPPSRHTAPKSSSNASLTLIETQDMGRFIISNWRTDRRYSLFPIDPYGQITNDAGLFLGSTGVMLALKTSGLLVPSDLENRYLSDIDKIEGASIPAGLFTGSAGMAMGLFEMGEFGRASRFLALANIREFENSHHSLFYGAAGVGLANLAAYHHTGDGCHIAKALKIGESLKNSALSNHRGVFWKDSVGVRLGYGYGQSGVALFYLRLSQITGDEKWHHFGKRALEFDISYGTEVEPGVISFTGEPENTGTVFPYIEQGSAGIAKVAIRYGLWTHIEPLLADCCRKYSGFPGLIFGLTGLLDVLTDAFLYSGESKYHEMARQPLQGLRDLYLFQHEKGIAAPGENLFRISCDLGTGLAGVMKTVHRHLQGASDGMSLDYLDEPARMSQRYTIA